MNHRRNPRSLLLVLFAAPLLQAQSLTPIPAFNLSHSGLVISRPAQPTQPFTVAGPRGVFVGTQDGSFESWILPIKLLSHLTIEAQVEGYSVPIPINPQASNIEVRPDHTTITYSHIAFTLRQIMFSPGDSRVPRVAPSTGPIVLFQIDSPHPVDLTFRFTPEMRWMWPKRNDGVPSPEWVNGPAGGFYILHMDYPDLAGAITIPGAQPGILAPYQERPQVHPLELHLHYDPKRDGTGGNAKFFPLLMAVATTPESASAAALGQVLQQLNASVPETYKAHATQYAKLLSESTTVETPDKSLNEAFQWGVVSIEQLKALAYPSSASPSGVTAPETALVAGYYASGDSARPGFGWFFGRDALYTLYAVNGFGDFALTRAELEFLIRRQRFDGKIMHEYSQTANDPSVDWPSFPYMYAAADATPLFLMAMRDYYRASGDLAFIQSHREAIDKAWAFETAPSSDTDHDGIYDNSQGTGWVESWPHNAMPHQEVYLALLDEQASHAYAALQLALGDPTKAAAAAQRSTKIHSTIETEYYDPQKGCYAFSHNAEGDPNGATDHATTVYPAIAWWDDIQPTHTSTSQTPPLAHPSVCLEQWAGPTLDTDWGLRDVANTEPFYDGMSYHQGSVWPLFTGWAALAEYRANQPLAGQQLLMQNVDLTWAQDPGAVTELLSGDFYVPFGRSTSHQLWSSAMVITPTLRGLFGISLDAATNTITVNPHLPAYWNNATIQHLNLGGRIVSLYLNREGSSLNVIAHYDDAETAQRYARLILRSEVPGARTIGNQSEPRQPNDFRIAIPLPPVEPILSVHELPTPGSRTGQFKVLSTEYGPDHLTLEVTGPSDSRTILFLKENRDEKQNRGKLPLKIQSVSQNVDVKLEGTDDFLPSDSRAQNRLLDIRFPPGQSWQTTKVILAW